MDQLGDLAAVLQPNDGLLRADISDAYYHLRLRRSDQEKLAYMVNHRVYLPISLNCGLSVAPCFFTKTMKPVVAALRKKGHRAFAYLDDFFGAARSSAGGPTSVADTAAWEGICMSSSPSSVLRSIRTSTTFQGAKNWKS